MNKLLLLTFDYELFLGSRSGIVDECLIQPTSRLASIMGNHGVKAIFFIDTTYLLTLEKYASRYTACKEDLDKIRTQLRELSKEGHYIFPHIHPHWLKAEYDPKINQWQLNDTGLYRFHSLNQSQREEVFSGSVRILRDILGNNSTTIDAFRAGGWSIQPFADFLPYFVQSGIKYEFSVIPGYYQFTNAQYFDYSAAPIKDYYSFADDVAIENSKGEFMEFTASMIDINPYVLFIDKFIAKIRYKLFNDHTFFKGSGQTPKDLINQNPINPNGVKLNHSKKERVAIELLTTVKIPYYLRYLKEREYMLFISHPKMITEHSMHALDKFLKHSIKLYSPITDFRTILTRIRNL